MAFLPSTLICRRLLSRSSFCSHSLAHHTRLMSTVIPPSKIQASSFPSPWLVLPPSSSDETSSLGHSFYSLADNRVKELKGLMPKPIHGLAFSGSSQGWIAMYNAHTLDLFLYDPISLRHIMLPPIHNLHKPKNSVRRMHKLILSCSPDDDEQNCRALMIYNCSHQLAVCCPGHSDEWTQVGIFPTKDANGERVGRCYDDIAYSTRKNLFFALTQHSEIETWDLTDLSSPRMVKSFSTGGDENFDRPRASLYDDLAVQPSATDYLVVADELFSEGQDEVLLVTRYGISEVAPDGSFIDYDYPTGHWSCILDPSSFPIMRKPEGLYPLVTKLSDFSYYPSMTIGFYIELYDPKEDVFDEVVSDLGDLALFIGSPSDSVALSTTLFPELMSNSIYFTDTYMETGDSDETFGGHDIGIFDFENKTVSPFYYPCDRPNLKKIVPSPIWFFPRLP